MREAILILAMVINGSICVLCIEALMVRTRCARLRRELEARRG